MAPKKKGNKKGNDDWESGLGEAPDPIAAATEEAKEAETAKDEEKDDLGGGGGALMAALKKNRANKKKKGKHVEEDFVEGEDPTAEDGLNGFAAPNGAGNLEAKAPEEANTEDLFAAPTSKSKGGKGKPAKKDDVSKEDDEDDGDGGGLKSKKEKEKEKKEREKQRKKEQVSKARDVGVASTE